MNMYDNVSVKSTNFKAGTASAALKPLRPQKTKRWGNGGKSGKNGGFSRNWQAVEGLSLIHVWSDDEKK